MAEIASWNNHKFVVKPKLIQSFEDLAFKGSCETTDKTTDGQKYVERKAGEPVQITFTVALNALTGCKNVIDEATSYVREARTGATDYMYLGSRKIGAKMMLTEAQIQEIVTQPGKGDTWISCKVKLTLKQGGPIESAGSKTGSGGPPWSAVYYYSGSSGAVQKVSATSNKSYADALAQAKAKVPSNALWSGATPKKATSQDAKLTDKALEAARARKHGKQNSEDKKPTIGLDARTENQNKASAQLNAVKKILNTDVRGQ